VPWDRSKPGFPGTLSWKRPRVRLSVRKPHEVHQRHQYQQEIRGGGVERYAVSGLLPRMNKVAAGMSQIKLPKMRQLLSLSCVYVERAARM
jgi:hypothetical protein